jgi:hypothetical protein
MTAGSYEVSDPLEDLEFDVPCENLSCTNAARFMGKGCKDAEYIPICVDCIRTRVRNFYIQEMVHVTDQGAPVLLLCQGCHLPMARGFNTHFSVEAI